MADGSPTGFLVQYGAMAVTLTVAVLNIVYSLFNSRRQLKLDLQFKKRFADFDNELRARTEARAALQRDRSIIIEAFIASVQSLQDYRDAVTFIIRNAAFSGSLDTASAMNRLSIARTKIEAGYSTLAARVPIDKIKPLHSSKHVAVETEALVRSFVQNGHTVPPLSSEIRDTLNRTLATLSEAQAGLRDIIQTQQLELTRGLISSDADSLD